jgi:pantetheine-phosphate adenylyltransferase
MTKPRIGVYPGTFDPVTKGHTDIIERASHVVDKLVVAVAVNAGKAPMFSLEDRVAMVEAEVLAMDIGQKHPVEVISFDNLLTDLASGLGASVIIRGLRAVSDFEYEFQMAGMNSRLNKDVETVFLMAADRYQFIASKFVKEIAVMGGDISHFVSSQVCDHLAKQRK